MNKKNTSKTNLSKIQTAKKASLSYHDFMTLFFVAAILIIDFFPYFKSLEIIAPQFLYLTVLNVIIGFYIYFNPILLTSGILAIFKKSYVFKIYLAFIVLSGLSIFNAVNVSLGVISFAEILVVLTMVLNFIILFYNRMHLIYRVAFLVGISAFFQAGIALYNFQIISSTISVSEALVLDFMKGNTGNINIFSASLLFKIPFIYLAIVNYKDWRRWFLAFALIGATLIIFLINARTSLLSLSIITLGFLVFYIKNSAVKIIAFKRIIFIVIPLVVSVIALNLIYSQSSDLDDRNSSTLSRVKPFNTKEGSINRRLLFYKVSLNLAKKNPVMGIGLGNFRIESIPYDLTLDSNIPLHSHNDFLELTAETGFFNGVLYFSIFVVLLVINLKRYIKTKDNEVRNIKLLTLLILIVYGLDAVFNFPFYRPTMQLCFCFIMVFSLVDSLPIKDVVTVNKKIYFGLIGIALIPLYFTYYSFKASNLEYLIQTDNINFENSGVLNGDDVVNRNPKIPNVFQTSESFVEYAGIYYFREKKYDLAIKLLDSANKINPYLGRPDFYKYLIAKERGKTDSAYFYIKKAFYRRAINNSFYQNAIYMALNVKDTTEILKMYNAFPKSVEKASCWAKAFIALNTAGYSNYGLNKFKQLATIEFPKDSVVNKYINDAAITNLIMKGQKLFASGEYNKALNTYNEGLKIDQTNIYIAQNIGFYYYNLGKPSQALPYFKLALKLPGLTDGKTEFFIGMCYVGIGDKENACKYFKSAGAYPDAQAQLNLHCK